MRRYFPRVRFSLLTLFAWITAMSLWLGGEMETVQERKKAFAWIQDRDGAFDICHVRPPGHWSDMYDSFLKDSKKRQAYLPSRMRLWMGDQAVYFIGLRPGSVTREQHAEIATLFPEAYVMQEQWNGRTRRLPKKVKRVGMPPSALTPLLPSRINAK